jgi:Ca-activated chloride channel family protein
MRFEWPLALLVLLLVPLALAVAVMLDRRRARYAVQFTNLEVLATCATGSTTWRSRLPGACVLLAMACALGALSRPQVELTRASEQASIVLAVDTSASMASDDVEPTRLAAAEQAIRGFLGNLPRRYRVGLVTFSNAPHVAAPLTRDRQRVLEALQWANDPGQGTAIGDALMRSVELVGSAGSEPQSAIVLLSDGAQTRGVLSPLRGALGAKDARVPVYTIALGTAAGMVWQGVIPLAVPPDRRTLRRIAQTTGGEFFAPTDEGRLDAVYAQLASRLGTQREWHELGFVLVGLAALCALAGGALAVAWGERLP